jgi:hypothetical protein
MTMKTNKLLALASFLALGFAGAGIAHAGEGTQRGQVQLAAAAAKAVVVGPAAIHAYSQFSGATLFVVDVVTGTDHDCAAAAARGGRALAADQIASLTLQAGQMACVASTGDRGIELLWHARKAAPAPMMVASSR